ncbi:Group-specific protein [Bacillus wiedmannii]
MQPVVDTIVFLEYYLFSITHLKENIISLLIVLGVLLIFGLIVEEMMKRIFKKNEEKYMWVYKVFEKVMGAFLLFYSMKTIIYFIALKHH